MYGDLGQGTVKKRTGSGRRCKSAFHEHMVEILELVADRVTLRGVSAKSMVLPHCTWDKFGEILADGGGRSLGLFDELMSFFSTMNMYSSNKMQVSDTREYQDFLQLFTGKSKTRETVTGNANFNMQRTSFNFMGFTQPYTAFPVIEDASNNAKGFTSRILWYFPKPVFATLRESILTENECETVTAFKEKLVDFLADLYIHGETTYQIEEKGKLKSVMVNRTEYTLTEEALETFEVIHDSWEKEICEKNPTDALIGGIFSRGKSHILRLAVPIQLLLTEFDTDQNNQATDDNDNTVSDYTPNIEQATLSGESTEETTNTESDMENSDIDVSISEDTTETDQVVPITIRQQNPQITGQAIKIAHSLVDTCLSQLCTLNDKTHILNPKGIEETESQPEFPLAMKKILHQIFSSPGEIVSFSELNKRGVFKKTIEQMHGKRLMEHVADEMDKLQLGQIHRFTVAGNSCQVYFLCKPPIPENMDEAWEFSKKLSSVGMSMPKYKEYYNVANEESKKHLDDYNNRKDTPVKQARKKLCLSSTQAI